MPAVSADELATTAVYAAVAMASPVRVVVAAGPELAAPAARALDVFAQVEAECSRFDPASALSRLNQAPDRWHAVPRWCFAALEAAWHAYLVTGGRFDPRVHDDLVALGYDRWPPRPASAAAADGRGPLPPWGLRMDAASHRVHPGGAAIDLGGIGKGLAVRWASQVLASTPHLVEAGGDCLCAGEAPEGGPWRVGVEDPAGSPDPVAVLALSDRACATSSVRRRRWERDGRPVHHLIDPSTGQPGGDGLLSVTVVHADPAIAEVWSKVLFLAGASDVATEARSRGLAACWIDAEGTLTVNELLSSSVVWRR